jgi:hypothetical protein
MIYMYRASGDQTICVISQAVWKVETCWYEEEENKDTRLLNVPAARMVSVETERAEIIPFVEEKRDLVRMEVCGGPGFEREKIDIRESVPHIKLTFSDDEGGMYSCPSREKVIAFGERYRSRLSMRGYDARNYH